MDEQIDTMIDEMIEKLMGDLEGEFSFASELPSFTAEANGTVSQIQFVIMTEAIPEHEEEPVQEEPAQEEEAGFWERFKDLFTGD